MNKQVVEDALRNHLRAITELLIRDRGVRVDTFESPYERWVRSPDGYYRAERILETTIASEWGQARQDTSQNLPTFASLTEAIQADPVLRPQFPSMVGAEDVAMRLDVNQLIRSMLTALVDAGAGELQFSEDRFKSRWETLAGDLYSDTVNSVTVVLLPGLTVHGAYQFRLLVALR